MRDKRALAANTRLRRNDGIYGLRQKHTESQMRTHVLTSTLLALWLLSLPSVLLIGGLCATASAGEALTMAPIDVRPNLVATAVNCTSAHCLPT